MVKSAAGEALSIAALQWRTALQFYGDRRTRTPILIIWVASFGGALHASVTTFFYLELGATEIQIGLLGFIMSAGSLLLSPFFGWLLDRRGVARLFQRRRHLRASAAVASRASRSAQAVCMKSWLMSVFQNGCTTP